VEKAAEREEKTVSRLSKSVLASRQKASTDAAPDPREKLVKAHERLAEGEDLIRRLKACIDLQERPFA
jgi:hypothetical protein